MMGWGEGAKVRSRALTKHVILDDDAGGDLDGVARRDGRAVQPELLHRVHHDHHAILRLEPLQLRLPSDDLCALTLHQVEHGGPAERAARADHIGPHTQLLALVAARIWREELQRLALQSLGPPLRARVVGGLSAGEAAAAVQRICGEADVHGLATAYPLVKQHLLIICRRSTLGGRDARRADLDVIIPLD